MDLISQQHNNKNPNTTLSTQTPSPSSSSPSSSRYENQKRRDWNTFCQYLRNHRPPLSLASCSGAHVLDFLRYLDQFGKTKVHHQNCAFFGLPNPPAPCPCPLRQAWGSLDALIGRLRAAYEENGGAPETSPFGSRSVRIFLREVRDFQAKSRGVSYEKKRKRVKQITQSQSQPPQPQEQQVSRITAGAEDYITSVKVYYEKLFGSPTEIVTALVFKTFKGKTSQPFGLTSGQEAELGGGKIVGFHGSSSDVIHSLGAYIATSSTPLDPSSNTVPAQGGDGGVSWDDGVHGGVKKIYVGQGDSCVTYFKADYEKASKPVLGNNHGKMSLLGAEEFELEPDEYVTAVIGYYDKIFGVNAPVITSLKFKTNKRTSIPYGLEGGTEFVLEKKDHKIVGFYGQAGDYLYKLGVNVCP